jgi:hypothetical protein
VGNPNPLPPAASAKYSKFRTSESKPGYDLAPKGLPVGLEDLEETELGFKVTIRQSKTDREGQGQTIAIVKGSVACPVAAQAV